MTDPFGHMEKPYINNRQLERGFFMEADILAKIIG
jgi:hypothetical protein